MKHHIFIISIILLFSISCNKKNEKAADDIIYTDITPDFQLSSVDSVYYVPFGPGCAVAVPVDSIAEYIIDLDGNGINDFKLEMSHWYQFVSASSPCANYNYRINLIGLSDYNKIAITGNNNEALYFELNQEIGEPLVWNNSADIMKMGGAFSFSSDPNGVKYFGLKMGNGTFAHFGWLLIDVENYTITVKEKAINATMDNSILAGQKE